MISSLANNGIYRDKETLHNAYVYFQCVITQNIYKYRIEHTHAKQKIILQNVEHFLHILFNLIHFKCKDVIFETFLFFLLCLKPAE